MHETPDIEVEADRWEEEQAVLAELAREEDEFRAREIERDIQDEQERAALEDRYQPIPGATLNGKPILQDVETGEVVDENLNPLNSCDALRVIDGVREDEQE